MNELEAQIGICYKDLTNEEKAAVDRIKSSYYDLNSREKQGSPTDIIVDLSVAIVNEMRQVKNKQSTVTIANDKLTYFLFDLMRDYLPAGTVEKLTIEAERYGKDKIEYENCSLLAAYAQTIANRL